MNVIFNLNFGKMKGMRIIFVMVFIFVGFCVGNNFFVGEKFYLFYGLLIFVVRIGSRCILVVVVYWIFLIKCLLCYKKLVE